MIYGTLGAQGNRYLWSPAVATSAPGRWLAGINDFDRFEESPRRMTRDSVIESRYLPEYYETMAAWLVGGREKEVSRDGTFAAKQKALHA